MQGAIIKKSLERSDKTRLVCGSLLDANDFWDSVHSEEEQFASREPAFEPSKAAHKQKFRDALAQYLKERAGRRAISEEIWPVEVITAYNKLISPETKQFDLIIQWLFEMKKVFEEESQKLQRADQAAQK